jgi:hypothetical protein
LLLARAPHLQQKAPLRIKMTMKIGEKRQRLWG